MTPDCNEGNIYLLAFSLSAEPGRALAVKGQSPGGAKAAAAGSGLLRLHCTGERTSSLVLGLLPAG